MVIGSTTATANLLALAITQLQKIDVLAKRPHGAWCDSVLSSE
jgi:hypothetical protein